MKRVLSFLVLVMMLFLVACNEELPENSAATEAPASTAESGAPVEEDTEEKEMAKLTISGRRRHADFRYDCSYGYVQRTLSCLIS